MWITSWRHEGVWRSRCIDPHFLELGTSQRWIIRLTPPAALTPVPLGRRLGGLQIPSGRRGEEKGLTLPVLELRPPPHVVQPVTSCYTDWAFPTQWFPRTRIGVYETRTCVIHCALNGSYFYIISSRSWPRNRLSLRSKYIYMSRPLQFIFHDYTGPQCCKTAEEVRWPKLLILLTACLSS
jgi:hypothetical protein